MKTKVELKAIGKNGSGKSLLLSSIKSFLEKKGLKAKIDNEKHKLTISGEICKKCAKKK